MVYVTCKLSSEAFILENFHMEKTTSSAFWDAFVPAYFGPEMSLEEAEKMEEELARQARETLRNAEKKD